MSVYIIKPEDNYISDVNNVLIQALKESNDLTKKFTIGVSGGSMPNFLCPILNRLTEKDRNRVVLFPVDERLVPANHSDNNVYGYLQLLLPEFSSKFVCIDESILDNANLSAAKFESALKNLGLELTSDGFPIFDILFLGLGPDGHTCSLFPTHTLLQENSKWIAAIEDSPKPPPRRVTITLPVIKHARHVAFLVTGQSKANVVKEILDNKNEKYPPAVINRLRNNDTKWLLDSGSASALQNRSKSNC